MTDKTGRSPSGRAAAADAVEPVPVSSKADIPNAWRSLATAPKGQRILVMCGGDAPWPVMIARWNGEKWASQDEATSGKKWEVRGWQPLPDPAPIAHQCSFCAKELAEVAKLIAGPMVFICNECVGICDEILMAEAEANAAASVHSGSAEGESVVPDRADAQKL
jgi:hypothetical protein